MYKILSFYLHHSSSIQSARSNLPTTTTINPLRQTQTLPYLHDQPPTFSFQSIPSYLFPTSTSNHIWITGILHFLSLNAGTFYQLYQYKIYKLQLIITFHYSFNYIYNYNTTFKFSYSIPIQSTPAISLPSSFYILT